MSDATIEAGVRLKAVMTGRVYTVTSVDRDEGRVYVSGLPPVGLLDLRKDIEADRIEVV